MRPIPSKKHHWAVLVLLAVVATNTALTFVSPRASADQANMLAEVFKQQDPARYGQDEVFGPSGAGAPWRLRLPAWRALLGAAVWLAGPGDPVNALRMLGALCLTAYLLAMYLLLYRETRSTSVATLVAAMSTAIFSVRRPYWGMGPIFTVSPTTLYMAFVPLLVLALTRSVRRRRVVGVFFLAGLAGNIDFVFAVNLVLVMLVVVVALGRSRPRVWAMAAAAAAAAFVGAAPAVWHYYVTFRAAEGFLPRMPLATLRPALHLAELSILYPGVLSQALRWLPIAAGLAIPAAIILSRGGRYRATHLPEWLWLLGASLLVALGLHGLMQLIGWRLGTAPPFIGFFDALRLAMLPLYALFAQAMIQLLRLTRTHRVWARAALGLLAALYLGTSYNTHPLRHMLSDCITAVAGEEAPSEGELADRELRAIASWSGDDRNTPPDAMFLTPRGQTAEIRLYARRAMLASRADVRHFYYLAPSRLDDWADRLARQRELLRPPVGSAASPDAIAAFVDRYWQDRGVRPADTYAIIEASHAPPAGGRLTEIRPAGAAWGEHWRLYRVAPLAPTTAPG